MPGTIACSVCPGEEGRLQAIAPGIDMAGYETSYTEAGRQIRHAPELFFLWTL